MTNVHLGTIPKWEVVCDKVNFKHMVSGYNAAGGVKGSLKYLSLEYVTTGTYKAQLKNLISNKANPTSIQDGNISTDYSTLKVIDLSLENVGLDSGGLSASSRRALSFNENVSGGYITIYVVNTSGSLVDLASGDVLQVSVFFKNSVAQFSSRKEDLLSLPRTTSTQTTVVPFQVDLTTPSSPTLNGAPLGSSVVQVSTYRYTVTIPYAFKTYLGTRAAMRVPDSVVCDNVLTVEQPSTSQSGFYFDFQIDEISGGTPSSDYSGVDFVCEFTNG